MSTPLEQLQSHLNDTGHIAWYPVLSTLLHNTGTWYEASYQMDDPAIDELTQLPWAALNDIEAAHALAELELFRRAARCAPGQWSVFDGPLSSFKDAMDWDNHSGRYAYDVLRLKTRIAAELLGLHQLAQLKPD